MLSKILSSRVSQRARHGRCRTTSSCTERDMFWVKVCTIIFSSCLLRSQLLPWRWSQMSLPMRGCFIIRRCSWCMTRLEYKIVLWCVCVFIRRTSNCGEKPCSVRRGGIAPWSCPISSRCIQKFKRRRCCIVEASKLLASSMAASARSKSRFKKNSKFEVDNFCSILQYFPIYMLIILKIFVVKWHVNNTFWIYENKKT